MEGKLGTGTPRVSSGKPLTVWRTVLVGGVVLTGTPGVLPDENIAVRRTILM